MSKCQRNNSQQNHRKGENSDKYSQSSIRMLTRRVHQVIRN